VGAGCGSGDGLGPAESAPVDAGRAGSAGNAGDSISLVFVGDVMFDGRVTPDLAARGLPPGAVFEPTREAVSGADLAAFNLETAASDVGEPIEKQYTFNADHAALSALTQAGFDVANVANNHVLDYGAVGLQSTLANLEAVGLDACGITTRDEPQEPLITKVKHLTIGFLGYADPETPTAYAREFLASDERPAAAEPAAVERDLKALRPRVDVAVVEIHWGLEAQGTTDRQRMLGHFMVDNGADVVVGHHPHVLQELEAYNGGLILYSLGHFVFEFPEDPEQAKSRLVRVYAERSGMTGAETLELVIRRGEWIPTPVTGAFEPFL